MSKTLALTPNPDVRDSAFVEVPSNRWCSGGEAPADRISATYSDVKGEQRTQQTSYIP
jgi:hypothetical protein